MSDAEERFIAAAVAPLGDNAEMQLMAERELRSMLEGTEPEIPANSLEIAAGNLEKPKPRISWRVCLYALVVLGSILSLIPVVRDYTRNQRARYVVYDWSYPDVLHLPDLPFVRTRLETFPDAVGKFSPRERLLLFGDLSKSDQGERFKAVWDQHPDDPAFFAEYAAAHRWKDGSLPSDYLNVADRLAPRNSWFRTYAAGVVAANAVDRTSARPRRPVPTNDKFAPYKVKNSVQLDEAIGLLEEAARQPTYNSYDTEMKLRRVAILPAGDDLLGRTLARHYLWNWAPGQLWIYDPISRAVSTRAFEAASAGDAPAFLRLLHAWETFCHRAVENSESTWVATSEVERGMRTATPHLEKAANELGLQEEAAHLKAIRHTLEDRKQERRAGTGPDWQERGGTQVWRFANLSMRVKSPPPITDGELKPGRMASHAMLARYLSVAGLLIFLIASVLVALVRFRHGKQARRLSGSLLRALGTADHAWILLGGVLIPLLIHFAVEQFTPAGGRDFGIYKSRAANAVRAGGITCLMLALPSWIAGRRLGWRLAFAGWKRRMIPEFIVCGAALFLWLTGCVAGYKGVDLGFDFYPKMLWLAGAAGIACLVPFVCALLGSRRTAIRWLTCCRALVPAYAFAMLMMAIAIPIHHAMEKHWTRRDMLTKIEPGVPSINRYEHEISRLMREELLEVLDRMK
jgi:hypothetical protein